MAIDLKQMEAVFFEVLAAKPDERKSILTRACAGNAELRHRVEQLLRAHEDSEDLPAANPSATEVTTGFEATLSYNSPDPTPGVVIAGRYMLEQKLGEGGMGEVWVAKQSEPVKRKVALKLIKAGMDSKSVVQRFEQERQALAMMDHPNIAKVLDGGITSDRRSFFVMELVNGLSLTKFCDEAKLGIKERLELFVPICQAVQHAHQKGIVHRDLKPSNILVTLVDGKAMPKVIDFGVAKATGGKLTDETMSTQFGAVIGTLEYMAPEQAGFSNVDVDTRADIYSLGIVLYELLTGLRPFDSKRLKNAALDEMIRMIREDEPSKPSTRLSTDASLSSMAAMRLIDPKKLMALLRGELDWVVMKCLEKRRDRRYESANGLARDIQHYLADEAVEARPPSTGYRLEKFISRNRGKVLAAGLLLLTLLGGIASTTWGMLEARNSAEAERSAKLDAQQAILGERKAKLEAQAATVAEKKAKEQTEKRLTQIERGVNLFAELLKGINPRLIEKKGGPTLYEILRERAEKAADQLEGDAIGDPVAVAGLQSILGSTLRDLDSTSKAVVILEKAVETLRVNLGADNPTTLTAMNNLALAYFQTGKLKLAVPLLEKTLEGNLEKRGPTHPETLSCMGNLAMAYREIDKIDRALPLLEQVLSIREKLSGPEDIETLTSKHHLGIAYRDIGRIAQALPLLEQVYTGRKNILGANHLDTLTSTTSLAHIYLDLGKLEDALRLFEHAVKGFRETAGPKNFETLLAMGNLASAYYDARKYDLALPLFKETLEAQRTHLGPKHKITLTTLNNFALAYHDAGKSDLAVPLFEESSAAWIALRGADDPSTLISQGNLAKAYLKVNRTKDAIAIITKITAGYRKIFGADSTSFARMLAQVSLDLLMAKQYVEAESYLRDCLAIREKTEPDVWTTFNTQSLLGGALLGQKKYAEAEPLLLKGYQGMKQRGKSIPPQANTRLPEALDRLIQLYTETNKLEEVKKWQAEKDKLHKPVEKK